MCVVVYFCGDAGGANEVVKGENRKGRVNQIIRECKYLTSVSHRTQCSKADCRFRVSPGQSYRCVIIFEGNIESSSKINIILESRVEFYELLRVMFRAYAYTCIVI